MALCISQNQVMIGIKVVEMGDFITLKTDDSYRMDVTENIHQIACIMG